MREKERPFLRNFTSRKKSAKLLRGVEGYCMYVPELHPRALDPITVRAKTADSVLFSLREVL